MTQPGATAAEALSVHDLTSAAKDVLEGAFPKLWVRGEVSGFKAYPSGHWYFTLKDAEAQVPAVIWKGSTFRIREKPADGTQVRAHGQLTVWPVSGKMQFVVSAIEADGEGLWQKRFDETKARLEKDGLLDPARKRPLPRFPRGVAVITSAEGAALRDILAVIARRNPAVHVTVLPAQVQGEGAAESIVAALERLARWVRGEVRWRGSAPEAPDLLIIGRGGGSREDLWCFNSEAVARAIAACPVPTISAVGHETDVTLADLVADLRAATPSVAAEHAVPVLADVREFITRVAGQMADALQDRVDVGRRDLDRRADALTQRARLLVERRRSRTARVAQRLAQGGPRVVERRRARLEAGAARLEARSPLAVLARGFGVARGLDGATLGRRAAFTPGMPFDLLLADGRVRAATSSVHDDGPHRRRDG